MSVTRLICEGCGEPEVYCRCQQPPDAPACPFCHNGELFLSNEPSQADDSRLFAVVCAGCHAQGPRAKTGPEAWRLWGSFLPRAVDTKTHLLLSRLRNPYGLSADELRKTMLAAADKIECFYDAGGREVQPPVCPECGFKFDKPMPYGPQEWHDKKCSTCGRYYKST